VGEWQFHGAPSDGDEVSTTGTSIEVVRRQPDGSWRYPIHLPRGLAHIVPVEDRNLELSA